MTTETLVAAPPIGRIRSLAHSLTHVKVRLIVFVFLFWGVQLVCWIIMMIYVQLFDPSLGQNVLYVTQISHWALVITCGTAATATWGVITSRGHHAEQQQQQTADTTHLESDIARLAELPKCEAGDELARSIMSRINPAPKPQEPKQITQTPTPSEP
jgi:hypothetical protein